MQNNNEKIDPRLNGVSETMLWTLHNRASNAMLPNPDIHDPKCIEIYQSLDYDYEYHFGKPDYIHAIRSNIFDQEIRRFLDLHPNAMIINLAEGLETQRYRVETTDVHWYSIDLPPAIAIRERFIPPDDTHHHIAKSALDTSWFHDVPDDRPAIITAQGLFMYIPDSQLAAFFAALGQRFPKSRVTFDYIPPWLSNRTLSEEGWAMTPHYCTPKMPWGIYRKDVEPTLSQWMNKDLTVHDISFPYTNSFKTALFPLSERWTPTLEEKLPGVCWFDIPA